MRLQFTLNTQKATLGDKPITLSAPPRLIDGELHLPLREVIYLLYHSDYALRVKQRQQDPFTAPGEPLPPPPALDVVKVYRSPDSAVVEFAVK